MGQAGNFESSAMSSLTILPRCGDLISWAVMSSSGAVEKKLGIFFARRASWKGYNLLTVLEDGRTVRDIYVRSWEVVSTAV